VRVLFALGPARESSAAGSTRREERVNPLPVAEFELTLAEMRIDGQYAGQAIRIGSCRLAGKTRWLGQQNSCVA